MTSTQINLHGTFLVIYGIGTLLTGKPGIGKSSLALSLIDRGHQFIADDAPFFYRCDNSILGENPLNRPLLHVRSSGLLDIKLLFGAASVVERHVLQLIIHLQSEDSSESTCVIEGSKSIKDVQGCLIPSETIPIINPRNLEVILETIVKRHLLKVNKEWFSLNDIEELFINPTRPAHS